MYSRTTILALSVATICSVIYKTLDNIANIVYQHVDKPYMDEIFHVPQAQQYCRGHFDSYDPKITTPPGLYLVTFVWLKLNSVLTGKQLNCDISDLRKTNHIFAIGNFIVILLIKLTSIDLFTRKESNTNKAGGKLMRSRFLAKIEALPTEQLINLLLISLSLSMLPTLFFFNSLYYTDPGSLFFVLLCYLLSINEFHFLSASSGMVSILFRQTNIVWVFYAACLVVLHSFNNQIDSMRARQVKPTIRDCLLDNRFQIDLATKCSPYILVGLTFITFLYVNQGIVIGDKEAHQMQLHFAQILYFLGFFTIFSSSLFMRLTIVKQYLYFALRNPLLNATGFMVVMCLIKFGRYAHPYLLADNRHLTFYLWRRVLDRRNSYVPYLLSPLYLVSCFVIWISFQFQDKKELMLYIICTILVLIPNGLLEPRYFIIPFVMLRLRTHANILNIAGEIFQSYLINAIVYYLFLHKTFKWSDSSEVQRIIW